MEYIIGFIINLVDFFGKDNIISTFFETTKSFRDKVILYFFNYVFVFFIMEDIMHTVSLVKVAIVFSANTLIFRYLYGTFKVTFIIMIWEVIRASMEFFIVSALTRILGLTVPEMLSSVFYYILFAAVFYSVLYFSSLIFKLWVKKNMDFEYLSKNELIMFALFPALNYSMVYFVLYENLDNGNISNTRIFIAGLLIFSTVTFVYFMGEICKSNKSRYLLLAYEKEEEAKKEYISAVKTAYETQRRLTHDYNREISTLKSILQLKDYQKLENYLNKLVGNSQRNTLVVLTHNTIIDAVLNQKYTEAAAKGITMEFSLDNLTGIPITDEDIVIILTNAIDNAITAAEKTEEKLIQLFAAYENDELLCVVKNSITEKIPIENNNIVKKDNNIYHGFGIKNIRRALSRYDSHMTLESTDTKFILTLLINF